jgi:hypothetical protein
LIASVGQWTATDPEFGAARIFHVVGSVFQKNGITEVG